MIPLRKLLTLVLSAVTIAPALSLSAQVAGLQDKLTAEYTLTKATASRDDIVKAGAVLELKVDGLLMYTTTTSVPPTNTFSNGKISSGVFGINSNKWLHKIPGTGSAPNPDNRKFVAGEKFWATKIYLKDDGVYFELFSDPINDVRYYTILKFPFPKGGTPTVDQMVSTVEEALKVVPSDDSGGDSKQAEAAPADKAAPAAAPAPAEAPAAAMAPIAPPPPPADAPPPQPKTIAVGQTKDQVVAIFGQPTRIANLGTKEIDYYPDMKVTFVKGKVSDVQ
jgi:hypothetical protein